MTPPSFTLDAPDYFTVGTVGPPGQRVFYIQGRETGEVVTLKTEKEQVRALGEYLAGLLEKMSSAEPAVTSDLPLLEPVTPAWAVGSLGVGLDEGRNRIVIVANAAKDDEDDEAEQEEGKEDEAVARFAVTRAQAAAFVQRAQALVRAGRPTCPLCSGPIDPGGHMCPRANGHAGKRV